MRLASLNSEKITIKPYFYLPTVFQQLFFKKKKKVHVLISIYLNERQSDREGDRVMSDIFHPLVPSPGACNSQGEARTKPGARSTVRVPHTGDQVTVCCLTGRSNKKLGRTWSSWTQSSTTTAAQPCPSGGRSTAGRCAL